MCTLPSPPSAPFLKIGLATGKAIMKLLDLDVGPPRPPTTPLSDTQITQLKADLDDIGFFQWIHSQ